MIPLALAPTEAAFVERRQRDWNTLDSTLRLAQERGVQKLSREQISSLSPLYCDVCADLARAQSACHSAPLLDYLQGLTAAAHAVLYDRHLRAIASGSRGSPLRHALEAFPRAIRRHKLAMIIAFFLFFVPLFGGLFATLTNASFAAHVVSEAQLRPMVEAYKHGFSSGRATGLDAQMAGFYINNNIGIALRCFATGLAFGLGSAFYLVENGLATGAMIGYVVAQGAGDNILTFVVGHSSLELGAIVLAGGAGLVIGWSIVAPGDRTRLASLQRAARSVIVVVFGAATMLALAAAIEGFWSASNMPSMVKRVVGCVVFVIVAAYIALAGRRMDDPSALDLERGEWSTRRRVP
ncbi:MAG TPA: stage II sporulation protein M [Polyangiaceae bacterium]|nr:stage II sporulation protein M [Polyangiaceae bacterium]